MKSLSLSATAQDIDKHLSACKAISPQVLVVFGSPSFYRDDALAKKIKAALPGTHVIGCSTAGEISQDGVTTEGLSLIAMHFDHTEVKAASAPLASSDQSYEMGRKIASDLLAPDLSSIFILMPGLNVNGSEFARGFSRVLPNNVVVTGGLAGDNAKFQQTFTMIDGDVFKDRIVAVGFYGSKVKVTSGSRGGWKPFGPARRVTKAVSNVLHEIDGKPALRLYKEQLGDKAADLPASGLLYPFAILDKSSRKETGLIRTILDVDHKNQTLTLAGDIPLNSLICLMHADTGALVKGAEEAAGACTEDCGAITQGSATILVSCVGRKIIMGSDVGAEIEAVIRTIGTNSAYAGFYSYGELCPFSKNGFAELHNQTMTITHISEK